jgi:hypothetical protein
LIIYNFLTYLGTDNFIDSNDLINDQENSQVSKLTWIADNDYNIFEKVNDNKWQEILNGIPTFEFDEVKKPQENSFLLFDPKREVFVQLNEHDSNYGSSEDTLRTLYEGRWLNSDFSDRLINIFGQKVQDADETKGKINLKEFIPLIINILIKNQILFFHINNFQTISSLF